MLKAISLDWLDSEGLRGLLAREVQDVLHLPPSHKHEIRIGNIMSKINTEVMKMEYEIMHTGIEELAQSHNVSRSIIQDAVRAGGWKQVKVKDDEQRLDLMKEQMDSMSVYNQALLTKKFLRLQDKVLTVAYDLLERIKDLEDVSALKTVSEVIELHRPHVFASAKQAAKDGRGLDSGLKIQIISKFGDGEGSVTNAVQISETAGACNGVGAVERGVGA